MRPNLLTNVCNSILLLLSVDLTRHRGKDRVTVHYCGWPVTQVLHTTSPTYTHSLEGFTAGYSIFYIYTYIYMYIPLLLLRVFITPYFTSFHMYSLVLCMILPCMESRKEPSHTNQRVPGGKQATNCRYLCIRIMKPNSHALLYNGWKPIDVNSANYGKS